MRTDAIPTTHRIAGLAALSALTLGVAAAPAGAQTAPTVVSPAPGACLPAKTFQQDAQVAVQVAGFANGTATGDIVEADGSTVAGGTVGSVDAAGNGTLTGSFATYVEAMTRAFTPGTLVVKGGTPIDIDTQPTPPINVPVTLVNAPVATSAAGRLTSPKKTVTWTFAGFAQPGQTIYAHIRRSGRTVRDYRFGVAGTCGTLEAKARLLPLRAGRVKAGKYTLQFDASPRYARNAAAPTTRLTVITTYRLR